jgi:HAD superfamily hydrolase (TIGR01549 family)
MAGVVLERTRLDGGAAHAQPGHVLEDRPGLNGLSMARMRTMNLSKTLPTARIRAVWFRRNRHGSRPSAGGALSCCLSPVEEKGFGMIRSVVFDVVGETLLDDTREFAAWADWIGVPRHTFSAVLGAVTAAGRNNAETFQYFRPGFDLLAELECREAAGRGEQISVADLYSDVKPTLQRMRDAGIWIGVAGNQTVRAAELLRALHLPVDAIATSGEWGVAKPDPVFFDLVAEFAPGERSEILYVGDHRDNDVFPAHAAGLRTALLRRGPWGYLWADEPLVRRTADWVVDSLTDLADRLLAPTI